MKQYLSILLLGFMLSSVALAEEDPLKSLFSFQQKMAKNGSTGAMMKLGEMYEQGQGVEQSFDKAIDMYKKARAEGHADAEAAIARVKRTRQAQSQAARQEAKRAREARRRAKEAKRRAEAERKAEAARKAREAARQKALAKQRAEEQARREAAAKAQRDTAARSKKAARAKAAAEARRKAQEQSRQEQARARAEANSAEKSQTAQRNSEQVETDDERFKSDPCKGPAARVMSICK